MSEQAFGTYDCAAAMVNAASPTPPAEPVAVVTDAMVEVAFAAYWDDQSSPQAAMRAALEAALSAPAKEIAPSRFISDAIAERRRQVEEEGWTAEHDDAHSSGQMAQAAACYATSFLPYIPDGTGPGIPDWPWEQSWWKPTDRRRNLVKAAALIFAEGDRLDRLSAAKEIAP